MPTLFERKAMVESGKIPDLRIERTALFKRLIEDTYKNRKGSPPDPFLEVFIKASIKEISVDFTLSETYLFKKLAKGYHNQDRHLLIVLYGSRANNKAYIEKLNEKKNDKLKGQLPENVQIISIHEFLDFIGLDSSLYQDQGIKDLIDNLKFDADSVNELLTARINAFNNREKFRELQSLGDKAYVYLNQDENNYLGDQ